MSGGAEGETTDVREQILKVMRVDVWVKVLPISWCEPIHSPLRRCLHSQRDQRRCWSQDQSEVQVGCADLGLTNQLKTFFEPTVMYHEAIVRN